MLTKAELEDVQIAALADCGYSTRDLAGYIHALLGHIDWLTAALAAERELGDALATAVEEAEQCPVCGGSGTHYYGIPGPDGADVDVSPESCERREDVEAALTAWRSAHPQPGSTSGS